MSTETNIITLKTKRNAENACVNWIWQRVLLPDRTLVCRLDLVAEVVGHDLVDERVPRDDGRGVR